MKLSALGVLLGFGIALMFAAAAPARSPRPVPCMHIAVQHDSIFISAHTLPCPELGLDSVAVWRAAAPYRTCDGVGEVDLIAGSVRFVWPHCRGGLSALKRAEP